MTDIYVLSSCKDAIEIRNKMMELGWSSKDRLSTIGWGGKPGYSIWFERYEWHGRHSAKLTGQVVCFHQHTDNLEEIDAVVLACAERALAAYEDFPDSIPYQDSKGRAVSEKMFVDWDNPAVLFK